MKVKLSDRRLLKSFATVISGISTALSLVLIFVDVPDNIIIRAILAILFLLAIIVVYFVMWDSANKKTKSTILVNGNIVDIEVGDIFEQKNILKVIPFNEYFDTQVDEQIVSSKTLNGQYILHHLSEPPESLSERIMNDKRLNGLITCMDAKRAFSKAKYPLGTIFKNNDYLLLAFSKFDADNRAYLDSKSMWECLINMWNEIDICYAGNTVGIPLMGSGITRTHNMHLSEQEILELIILSLKVSGIKINWNLKFKIIIYPPNAKNINFYDLSSLSD